MINQSCMCLSWATCLCVCFLEINTTQGQWPSCSSDTQAMSKQRELVQTGSLTPDNEPVAHPCRCRHSMWWWWMQSRSVHQTWKTSTSTHSLTRQNVCEATALGLLELNNLSVFYYQPFLLFICSHLLSPVDWFISSQLIKLLAIRSFCLHSHFFIVTRERIQATSHSWHLTHTGLL